MSHEDDKSRHVIERYAKLKRRLSIPIVLLGILVLALMVAAVALADPEGSSLLGLPLGWVIWGAQFS